MISDTFGGSILAGDIGGTHTRFGLFAAEPEGPRPVFAQTLASKRFASLSAALGAFFRECPEARACGRASLGIAGPVRNNRCQATNLPWLVDGADLAHTLGLDQVTLLNDIEATAWGLVDPDPAGLHTLTQVQAERRPEDPEGHRAILAAGTGLGEALLLWDGATYRPFPTEGGHATFGPTDELQTELWRYIHQRQGHVSWEKVASGPGLETIYRFLLFHRQQSEPSWLALEAERGDAAATISRHARDEPGSLCHEAMQMFFAILGAEAGNLALRTLATGGIYLAGGILPQLRDLLPQSPFLDAFVDKGAFRPMLEAIPVHLVLNSRIALAGAARHAASMAHEPKAFRVAEGML